MLITKQIKVEMRDESILSGPEHYAVFRVGMRINNSSEMYNSSQTYDSSENSFSSLIFLRRIIHLRLMTRLRHTIRLRRIIRQEGKILDSS